MTLASGVNNINLFLPSQMLLANRLECLSLGKTFQPSQMFEISEALLKGLLALLENTSV